MFDFIAALNEFGDTNDFHEGLDGWIGFSVNRVDGEHVLTIEYTPWDEAKGGPGEPAVSRYKLTELID